MYENDEKIYYSLNSSIQLIPNDLRTHSCQASNHFLDDPVKLVKLKTERNSLPFETTHSKLVWAVCERGKGSTCLNHPKGLTIDKNTGVIYVADCLNHRIQCFEKNGNWIKSITSSFLTFPWGVTLFGESLYVTCSTAYTNYLLKLCRVTGDEKGVVASEAWLAGLDTDLMENIYACDTNRCVHVFDSTLNYINRIKLKSYYLHTNTETWDVKIFENEFIYVLCEESQYPVQLFNLKGKLVKCIIHQSEISRGYFFHIDWERNIIISDNQESVIRVFSRHGDLIVVLGETEHPSDSPMLKTPTGVSLSSEGELIVCDFKSTHALQALQS